MVSPLPRDESPRAAEIKALPKLATAAELAGAKLGDHSDLAVMAKTARDLADHYLREAGTSLADAAPHTQVTATYLALTLRNQLRLLQEIEQDLHQMVLDDEAKDFGEALLVTTMNGRHKKTNGELRRLHNLAAQLRRELAE